MCKVNKIPSEIRKFFAENCKAAIMEEFTKLLEKQNIDSRYLRGVKCENCKLTNKQIFHILVLMPFFSVPGFSHYAESVLNHMFDGKKDIFYSFIFKLCIPDIIV